MSLIKRPLFSIISVTLNCAGVLQKTAESVLEQSVKDFEYILQDGSSSDGTLEYCQSLLERDARVLFRSERDFGIYDAMNRAIEMATGEYVIFLNAGDAFVDSETLAMVAAGLRGGVDVLYGDAICQYPLGQRRIRRARALSKLNRGMSFCHQSVVVKTALVRRYPFETKYKIAADYDFFLKLHKMNYAFSYVEFPVAVVLSGGVSDVDRVKTIREYRAISNEVEVDGRCIRELYFLFQMLRQFLALKTKKILPDWVVGWITQVKCRAAFKK